MGTLEKRKEKRNQFETWGLIRTLSTWDDPWANHLTGDTSHMGQFTNGVFGGAKGNIDQRPHTKKKKQTINKKQKHTQKREASHRRLPPVRPLSAWTRGCWGRGCRCSTGPSGLSLCRAGFWRFPRMGVAFFGWVKNVPKMELWRYS